MVVATPSKSVTCRDDLQDPGTGNPFATYAGQAYKDGITKESFPQGTVFSMGLHPRRDGKPAGDRGMSGLFQCPKGTKPQSGKHCDTVPGAKAFGAGELPKETADAHH